MTRCPVCRSRESVGCWRCGGVGFVDVGDPPTEGTYQCQVCGGRYVEDADRNVRCVQDHHCHSAEQFRDCEGRFIYIPPLPACVMIDTTEVVEAEDADAEDFPP
jgi:hypothetical protein